MANIVLDLYDVLHDLQAAVEAVVKHSGLEVTDDIVEALMACALDASDTALELMGRPCLLSLVEPMGDRLAQHRDFHSVYWGDYFSMLSEICREDDDVLRQLANLGVAVQVEVLRRFLMSLAFHPDLFGRTVLDTDSPLRLLPSFELSPNRNDAIVRLLANRAAN